jgi:hypothetical protein
LPGLPAADLDRAVAGQDKSPATRNAYRATLRASRYGAVPAALTSLHAAACPSQPISPAKPKPAGSPSTINHYGARRRGKISHVEKPNDIKFEITIFFEIHTPEVQINPQ